MVPWRNGGELALLYALIFVFFALTPRADSPARPGATPAVYHASTIHHPGGVRR